MKHQRTCKDEAPKTSAAIAPAEGAIKPEFLRLSQCEQVFGLGRSTIYRLLHDNAIHGVCLRKAGAATGIRLISFDSLKGFIESQADEPAFLPRPARKGKIQ